ncbi:MFS transporter [Actinoallomurus iriomotensis]|uniref:MFS transporter n=1 Tax=Actinoallomurus iriomotensis TaxID=478107 RepID=A0A9W6VQY1_9ACTN|nr:MFS transporter [Actinoallomurus iriomotensis]GLY75937.1 MFS transporter [Actinoallomurus iriomotensis]GLY87275.1 MFS transporter [Actinoallomurus iriomotensis]
MGADGLRTIETNVPARLDRLPWARWHWLILVGLGTVWILDGLEVNVVGVIGPRLTSKGGGLGLSDSQVGLGAALYVAGACAGALVFGYLTDRFGRKKLFLVTLAVYLLATVATAFSFSPLWFYLCRIVTGMGIGGEYAAVNSAIDELIPARLRGTVDVVVNGSFWLGTTFAALLSVPVLNASVLPENLGWRLLFALGAILGIGILFVRRIVPESPRWLFIHGRDREAEEVVRGIEREVADETGRPLDEVDEKITIRQRHTVGFGEIARTAVSRYPRRTVLGLSLFVGQAFLYNAVFFTYALVLSKFFKTPDDHAGWYLIPIGLGNFGGAFVLGRLFDRLGRKVMISGTYILSGVLLIGTAMLFRGGHLSAVTLTVCWVVVFFFASAGASSAYLTVSEIFPMETRAMAIAAFYAVGTALGGIIGPLLFGKLVDTGHTGTVAGGYLLGAGLMILAGIVELVLGVEAAGRSLEDIAAPLSAEQPAVSAGR